MDEIDWDFLTGFGELLALGRSMNKPTFKRPLTRIARLIDRPAPREQNGLARMDSTKVIDQLDLLIDDLLNEASLPAASLASMLMAARDSVKDGYHVALARRVWDVSNTIKDQHQAHSASSLPIATVITD